MTEIRTARDTFRRISGEARFDAIRHRSNIVGRRMANASELAHELPEGLQGSRLGIETLEAIENCRGIAARLSALKIGAIEFANAAALNVMRDFVLDLTLALNVFSAKAAAVYRALANSNYGKDAWFSIVAEMRFAGVSLANDAAWLAKEAAELNLHDAGAGAQRAKRMRDRRKAGFRMVTVAIHKQDIETFRRLGLLTGKDEPEAADLEEAAQSLMAGALATLGAIDNEAQPEAPTKIARAMNPALALWPAALWLDRLSRFVAVSLGRK